MELHAVKVVDSMLQVFEFDEKVYYDYEKENRENIRKKKEFFYFILIPRCGL